MPVTLGIVSAGAGAVQSIIGGIGAAKARRQLEGMQSPTYTRSKSITDYYNNALNRYQQSPTQSNLYKMQAQQIQRGTNQGLAALQSQGGGKAMGGVAGLIQAQNDSYLKAAAAAEQDQSQKFAQLGNAAQAMAGEDKMAFNINQMMPFERKYNLLSQKAAANGQLLNAGLQNTSGGLTSGIIGMASKKSGVDPNGWINNTTDPDLKPSTYRVPLATY